MVTTVVRNDTSFDLQFTAKNQGGTVLNLENASEVKFKMALPRATACKIIDDCEITIPKSGGICTYTVGSSDFDAAGLYEAELQITYTDGKVMTCKMDDFHVIEDLPSS